MIRNANHREQRHEPRGPGQPAFSRHGPRFRSTATAFAVVLVMSMLFAGFPPLTGSARAAGASFPPADLMDNSQLSQPGSIYAATSVQTSSLQNLEQAAIANTLKNHQLPASDAAAVQTWGRGDAEAELWGLIVQAINLPATC